MDRQSDCAVAQMNGGKTKVGAERQRVGIKMFKKESSLPPPRFSLRIRSLLPSSLPLSVSSPLPASRRASAPSVVGCIRCRVAVNGSASLLAFFPFQPRLGSMLKSTVISQSKQRKFYDD